MEGNSRRLLEPFVVGLYLSSKLIKMLKLYSLDSVYYKPSAESNAFAPLKKHSAAKGRRLQLPGVVDFSFATLCLAGEVR